MILSAGLFVAVLVLGIVAPRWLDHLAAPQRHPRIAMFSWLCTQGIFMVVLTAMPLTLWFRPGFDLNIVAPSAITCAQRLRDGEVFPWFDAVQTVVWLAGLVGALRVVCMFGMAVVRHRRMADAHVSTLRVIGRRYAAEPDVYLIHGYGLTAYSLGGNIPVIVVGEGVLALRPDERDAVLAHERAHLRGRHHLLVVWVGAFRRAFPFLPLAKIGATWVHVLVELSADRHAVAVCGRESVRDALVNCVGGQRAGGQGGVLKATPPDLFVHDRVSWLSGCRTTRRTSAVLDYPLALSVSVVPVFAAVAVVTASFLAYCAALGG